MLVEEIKKTSIKAPSGRNIILYAFTFRPDGALETNIFIIISTNISPRWGFGNNILIIISVTV